MNQLDRPRLELAGLNEAVTDQLSAIPEYALRTRLQSPEPRSKTLPHVPAPKHGLRI